VTSEAPAADLCCRGDGAECRRLSRVGDQASQQRHELVGAVSEHDRRSEVAVTASWSTQALQAVSAVMSEQLARLCLTPAEDAGQVLLLRQYATLGERPPITRRPTATRSLFGLSESRSTPRSARSAS
jgi:hypothetical protein